MRLNLLAINTIFTLQVSPNFTMYSKRLLAVFCCICFVCVLALVGAQRTDQKLNFHTANELGVLKKLLSGPIGPGDYFSTHAHCKSCHGKDSLLVANIAPNGEDINVVDDWQASMMALSAKDPFWRAKVSHEILVDPDIRLSYKIIVPLATLLWAITRQNIREAQHIIRLLPCKQTH